MRMLARDAAWSQHVRFGKYVGRRLRTAGQTDLQNQVISSTVSVQTLGRSWEDADFAVQEALADRDAGDDVLDALAREARRKLISRSANAEKVAPYILVMPDGVLWYALAPVGEELSRYKQLRDRLSENLTEDDELRKELVPRLQTAIDAYATTEQALEDSRNTEARARDQLESGISSWRDLIDRTYGALTAQVGSDEADKFFPRARKGKKAEEEARG